MKILFTRDRDFKRDERESFVEVVHSNILADMTALISAAQERDMLKGDPSAETLFKYEKRQPLGKEENEVLKSLWTNPGRLLQHVICKACLTCAKS